MCLGQGLEILAVLKNFSILCLIQAACGDECPNMVQFARIQPYTMVPTFIIHDAGNALEVSPVHQSVASGAGEVALGRCYGLL